METYNAKIEQNIILAPLTTYKIGGPAQFFFNVQSRDDLLMASEWATLNNTPITCLAGGSNVLINDTGIKGLVLKIDNKNLQIKGDRLEAEAGANLMATSRLANGQGYSGLEWAIGIPGSVGGAVRGNAGAHGFYMADIVETIECFDLTRREFKKFSNKDCEFTYKESLVKKNPNLIIWNIEFKLIKGNPIEIKANVEKFIEIREKSQPRLASAGCVFKNLDILDIELISPKLANYIQKNNPPKSGKVGAGWLIDLIGLKGIAKGGAKVSLEHANFIVSTGRATANDVIFLINLIKKRTYDQFGITLQEEIQYLGF
ncbi:MAG: UDP-N-acetylmuramate dehydrogenase [Candidatus Falkowbacteria bacterium]|nr:UDP-N-acetylmuramate dehydrogenase [Candidatus Falkowbacteria bacterium]